MTWGYRLHAVAQAEGEADGGAWRQGAPLLLGDGGLVLLAARVQGLRRYYALMVGPGQRLQLTRLFDTAKVLAEHPFEWQWEHPCKIGLEVAGATLIGWVNDEEVIRIEDVDSPLRDGGVAFVCEEGLITSDQLEVRSKEGR